MLHTLFTALWIIQGALILMKLFSVVQCGWGKVFIPLWLVLGIGGLSILLPLIGFLAIFAVITLIVVIFKIFGFFFRSLGALW